MQLAGRRLVLLAPFGIRPKGTLSQRMLPLAQQLAAGGAEITILAPSDLNPADAGRSERIGGVQVEHLPLPTHGGPAGMLQTTLSMARRALALRPELVHLFKPKGYGALAALLLRRLRPSLPLIVDTDDWEGRGGWNDLLPYPPHIKLLINWQERTLPSAADAVTVASSTLQTQVWGFGVDPSRMLYLPNGIHPGPRGLPARETAREALGLDGRPTALLYTRFWEFPVSEIVAALVGLAQLRPELRLLVIGAGERGEERKLDRLAARAGVAHMLDQRGWADAALIANALAAADVALFPMRDSLITRAKASAKLLELLHAGLPVIGSAVGEAREYLADGAGLLVPPDDPGALAQAVASVLNDAELAAQLSRRGRERVERHYAWPMLAETLAALYRRLLRVEMGGFDFSSAT